MTTLGRLGQWRQTGILTEAQHDFLTSLVRRDRFSVFLELNALLYLGVISLAGGLVWTFQTYFTRLGDVFILAVLSLLFAGSLFYCFSRARAFSVDEVESPNFVFDYVLYLSCLTLSAGLGYIEFRFSWLNDAWENYLLLSSIVFFVLAYRFDNRFVLSLALSSFAGFCGLKVSRFGYISSEPIRTAAITYAVLVSLIGVLLFRRGIKKHFLDAYLHVAANVMFIALVSGVFDRSDYYLIALILLATTAILLGIRFKRFVFVVYGTVFGYIGISAEVIRPLRDAGALFYIVVSGTAVLTIIALLARKAGREV